MRTSEITRNTNETKISAALYLDGSGKRDISTGIGFFDHMLELFSAHSGFDLTLTAKGDLHVDCHHTIEDTGIVLGQLLKNAMGDKIGINRYGSFFLPMDEVLCFCAVDISGRPYIHFDVPLSDGSIGGFDCEMLEEFMRAFAMNAGITLHIKLMHGKNKHHIVEACFKALAGALKTACGLNNSGVIPSTKGML